MATKKLKKKVQRKTVARKAENPVVESAREIWLAGLGAFSLAQAEGEKLLAEGGKLLGDGIFTHLFAQIRPGAETRAVAPDDGDTHLVVTLRLLDRRSQAAEFFQIESLRKTP